ncbi:MAG: type II toxin-antitoxin system RelE/ParE family toxin [Magnetococcales bacterium]|nr:type II toxin-antitoxin system RelE/ParE family toxin [Magnetococcales bacterium]
MKVHWNKRALANLANIRFYIFQENPRAASKVASRILEAANRLAEFPEKGRLGPRPNTRELVIPNLPFIVLYRLDKNAIKILRVFHTARKWPIRL